MAEGNEQHWAETHENPSITSENRQAFVDANKKYATESDALFGGYNAQKAVGAPFKVPESMDSLPDDASRSDFTAKARGLLGINIPKDLESLKDLDFKAGLAEGAEYDENFVGIIKQWAVDNEIPMSTLEKLAPLYNGPLTEYSVKAHKEATDKAELDRMQKCNDELVAMPDIGTKEKLAELSELFRRAIVNYPGVTPDDAKEIADAMVAGGLTQNSKLTKIMLDQFAPLAAEGGTLHGDGHGGSGNIKQLSPREAAMARWPKSKGQWPEEGTKWEDVSNQTKKALGYKES